MSEESSSSVDIADLHRVELHCHFGGALRPSTVFAIARRRGHKLPVETPEEFAEFVRRKEPSTLKEFLAYFPAFMAFLAGDRDGIVTAAQDFVEDCARNKICYVETRYMPQMFARDALTAEDGLKALLEGFELGSKKFGVKVRTILILLRAIPEFCDETLRLAKLYQPHGVVGVDVAGDDKEDDSSERGTHVDIVRLFGEARRAGIHRTAHAGENSGSAMVAEALNLLHAERIGHGYHTLDDPLLYQRVLNSL